MAYSPVRLARWSCLALCLLAASLALGCGNDGAIDELGDIGLSTRDVPAGWLPADFAETEGRTLWDVLPDLLTSDSDAQLFIRAFQDETGLHGAATILIQTEEPAALPETTESERVLGPLARLLTQQDALLISEVLGGDPGTYFATTDAPLEGSLRSRLVRLLGDGYLYSDSITFSVGPVLAVVTVWYPEQDGPFREVEELVDVVNERLQTYVDGG